METNSLIVLCFCMCFAVNFLISLVASLAGTMMYVSSKKLLAAAAKDMGDDFTDDLVDAQNTQLRTLTNSIVACSVASLAWLVAGLILLSVAF